MDEAQRKQIIQYAAIAAAIGPVLLLFGKVTKGIGSISTGIGKFATAVGKAGGGIKGFLSVLGSSPAVWLAVAAATIYATVAIADYVSGAKKAREALKGMQETADKWKSTAAETFYGNSKGLSFFGMSKEDFVKDKRSAQEWLNGLIAVWSDGEKESNEIVAHWTDSFKTLTDSTRTELQALKETADKNGYTSVSEGLAADIQTLDQMDTEIERLLKKRQNGFLTEKEKIRLQELIAKYDDSNAVKPKLSVTVGIYGYDLIAYRKFIAENPVEVQGIVKLGELYENPQDVLLDPKTKFWQDGQEIPVEAVPKELLTADKVAVLDEDGTLHVMVAPDVTGAQESIDKLRTEVAEVDQFGTTALGRAAGLLPTTTLDMIDSALERIETAKGRLGQWWSFLFGGDSGIMGTLDTSMKYDFPADRVAELSTHVAEIVPPLNLVRHYSL